ncbi:N-acetylmuramoyl-L-alanine amidase [Pseudonocardia sp.]|uniref:N-acetylmuramoyl-L-alanine amidase n=1 Tax=Pseudonocardia sp. TaxID=60912 RepID=UPI003D0A1259
MLLTDLAQACRASGLPVTEVAGWASRGRGQMSGVRTVVCHHTAGPATGEFPSLNVIRDGRPGLAGPLSQLGLGRSGRVYVIAAGLCSHTGVTFHPDQGNRFAIGIEAEATGTAAWPRVQLDAYAGLCAALTLHYGLGVGRVLGHKEIAAPAGRKIDPNFDMDEFRRSVARLREDDMFTDADRQLLTRLALRVDVGFARDQILTALGVDPHGAPASLTAQQRAAIAPARRVDVGLARDQILAEIAALSARIAELEALLTTGTPEPDASGS